MKNYENFLESIRQKYQDFGVDNFYKNYANEYINPHEPIIKKSLIYINDNWNIDFSNVLDLAAGSGEVTKTLMELGYDNIEGLDPYTYKLYEERTGKFCHRMSFDDIMKGNLQKNYSCIICSFALHLADVSKLPMIIWNISQMTKNFIILSPHKKPIIKEEWGMKLKKSVEIDRIKIRYFYI